ncbi:porin [Aquabacterium sp.]|uniref:porin n=1 Tax=Aquabacterium sp. TaxID=1872578 RepID=UPI002C7ADC24|nr:porin [Aquabacterium sp.]HSW07109.1 porin [Aquabacterium sp.]
MKKSLLALAAFGLFAGAASAQSTVTLFGIVDAGFARLSAKTTAGSKTVQGVTNSGLNSSRLGFRGVEDLGGGLKAGFWLEGALSNDDGNAAGFNFQRRSTVSLMGNFGEIRLGRDYTPHFWNTTVYDPFGTNGIGQALTHSMIGSVGAGANGTNSVRSNNTIGYILPGNLGGINGQVQIGFGENLNGVKTNNYLGGRVGYAAGPVSAHVAYGKTEGATDGGDVKYFNVGASYDAGVVKPMVMVAQEKSGAGLKIMAAEVGVTAPLGQGELRAAYSRYDVKDPAAVRDNDWNKIAVGYGYNLSKRTQLYSTYARISNKGAQNRVVANNGLGFGAAVIAGGTNNSGVELGIRHSF